MMTEKLSKNSDVMSNEKMTKDDGARPQMTPPPANGTTSPSPCCRNLYDGNGEALGWAIDAVPRGIHIMGTAIFVSTALLGLAKEAAGCQTIPSEGETTVPECLNKVYGIRPSSLLTTIMLVVGLASSLSMPMMGAILDHTHYRRAVGRISAVVMTVTTFLQIFVSRRTWFIVAILQVVSAFFYIVHSLVAFAYLPELTQDAARLVKYSATFTAVQYLGMVFFLISIVLAQTLFKIESDVQTARLAQSVSFCISTLFFGYAWKYLFGKRPASHKVPEHQNIFTTGFLKIWDTAKNVVYANTALKYFLVSLAFSESAVSSFATVAVTFMTEHLQFTSAENGIAILILLISSVPGSFLGAKFSSRFNLIRSLQMVNLIWITNTLLAAIFLKGPGQQKATYAFASIWGVATGWVFPTERAAYCTIIPQGMEAELMGIYLCATQILAWLPPLVFTAMNESGVSMRVSIASLCIFFGSSFMALFMVARDYNNAVDKAQAVVTCVTDDHLTVPPRELVVDTERGDALEITES